jgi:preprotein translocase subunit YajC
MRRLRPPPVDFPLVQDFVPVLFLVGIALLFWVLLIRPQARRQRELAHMQSTLEVGDEVMLTSGVFGTVRGLDDDVAQVEIADGVTIRVARGAVGRVVHEEAGRPDARPVDDGEVSEEN